MKKTREYGEFFPPSVPPVVYNETQGNYYMPLTKEEVLSRGWSWEDQVPGTFGKETVLPEDIPNTIEEIDISITSEILKCIECSRNYNIVLDELTFYQREKIPLPRSCPDCRYKHRFNLRLPRKLWHRGCMCDKKDHFHGENHCNVEFKTSFEPKQPKIVFCERCYKAEIL